jgi:hypothetical protein
MPFGRRPSRSHKKEPGAASPKAILMAKSAIRTIYVRHRPEKQVSQHSRPYGTDFAISIKSGQEPNVGRQEPLSAGLAPFECRPLQLTPARA